jgi:hypothetical protein
VISGVQLISVGLLGEYIGRFFLSHNKQPQYLIKSAYRDLADLEQDRKSSSKKITTGQRS